MIDQLGRSGNTDDMTNIKLIHNLQRKERSEKEAEIDNFREKKDFNKFNYHKCQKEGT